MGIVRAASRLRTELPYLLQTSRVTSRQFTAGPIPPLGTKLAKSLLDLHSVKTTHKIENTRNTTIKRPQLRYLVAIVAAIVSGIVAWFFSTVKGWSLFPSGAAEESSPDSLSISSISEDEKKPSFDDKPWYQAIRDGISKEEYQYSSPQIAADIYDLRSDLEEKVYKAQSKFFERYSEASVPRMIEESLLTMEGVALLAAYLREKKGVDNLFVCKSLEAFQAKLNEVSLLEGNTRLALVLPMLPEGEDSFDLRDGEYRADLAHKIAVGIEKTDTQIKIVILDTLRVLHIDEFSPARTLAAAKDLKYVSLIGIVSPLWYIYHSTLDRKETSVYYSKIERLNANYGCETFALSDGVSFLKDPHFFDNIQATKLRINQGRAELILQQITRLPPNFMKGSQSLNLLKEYYEENINLQGIEALKSKVDKHLIEVSQDPISLGKRFIKYYEMAENPHDIAVLKGTVEQDETKMQNHLMNQKSIKYHLIVADALEKIPEEELQSLIRKTLLTVPRLPLTEDQEPQTLSDLHFFDGFPRVEIL